MHRAAYHFIKALGISSLTRKRQRKGAATVRATLDSGDEESEGDVDDELEDDEANVDISMNIEASADDADEMAETMNIEFELGDTIGKLLAFVNQVRVLSEGVREYLAHCCRHQGVKPIELLLWVCSRWGSLSHCLGTVLIVHEVCRSFVSVTWHY